MIKVVTKVASKAKPKPKVKPMTTHKSEEADKFITARNQATQEAVEKTNPKEEKAAPASDQLKDFQDVLTKIAAGPCDTPAMSPHTHAMARGCQILAQEVLKKWWE